MSSDSVYEVIVDKNVMIPMRDSVRLAADIYRPARGGKVVQEKLPILLQRTPYDKESSLPNFDFARRAAYFASHGYISAVQDCRGRFRSEGRFRKYLSEARDGYDTIEWLAGLPYTNGAIGMWGTSYAAHVQADAAQLNPPHLKTIILNMGGIYNGWHHGVRNHGALEMKQLVWAFSQIKDEVGSDPAIAALLERQSILDWIKAYPFTRGLSPLAAAGHFEDYLFQMFTHETYDGYWKQLGLNWSEHLEQTADIPMLLVSGWYDAYCGSAISSYTALSRIKRGPIRLLVGPWLHGKNDQSFAGDVEFGKEAAIEDFFYGVHLRWYDFFLKGRKNGVDQEPAVRLFIMGTGDGHKDEQGRLYHGGFWRSQESWVAAGTDRKKYFLHSQGCLSPQAPESGARPCTYLYDPRDPVPTIGGSTAAARPLYAGGAFDQRERDYRADPDRGFFGSKPPYLPLKTRSDVLVFQTGPLEEDLQVSGPVTVVLFVSSSAADTDFTAKIIDVYPPSRDFPSGFEMNLTDGICRARFRSHSGKTDLLKPGKIYRLSIEPFPTANVFKKGHRIRIDISSSNFPRFDRNPNTGEPFGLSRRLVVAKNAVHVDRSHPSHLLLPVVPAGRTAAGLTEIISGSRKTDRRS